MVSGVLWLALRRARSLLVRAVTEQSAAENLSRFFDEPVARRIRGTGGEAEIAGAGVRREASILYVDLRGFSMLPLERSPASPVSSCGP